MQLMRTSPTEKFITESLIWCSRFSDRLQMYTTAHHKCTRNNNVFLFDSKKANSTHKCQPTIALYAALDIIISPKRNKPTEIKRGADKTANNNKMLKTSLYRVTIFEKNSCDKCLRYFVRAEQIKIPIIATSIVSSTVKRMCFCIYLLIDVTKCLPFFFLFLRANNRKTKLLLFVFYDWMKCCANDDEV